VHDVCDTKTSKELTPADVGLVKQGRRMAGESVLAGLHSYSNASSGEDLFSLRNLNQNEEIFRDISLLANQWARAYVFHDPSFPWF
jgi:hypothetical protein